MSYDEHVKSIEKIKNAEQELSEAASDLLNIKLKKDHHRFYITTVKRIMECYENEKTYALAQECSKNYLKRFEENERIIQMIANHYEVNQ